MSERFNLVKTRASRVLLRTFTPIGPERLRTALKELIGDKPQILFVHSSLSNCGRFTAGPQDVLSALRERADTICYPTFTYCYPAATNNGPGPVFDPKSTPSQTGLLTEMFRSQAGVIRSIHATHSIAAAGPLAKELSANHYRQDAPCGIGSPYAQFVGLKASILMFGVSFHSYTLFHTAEDASGSEYAYEEGTVDHLRVIDEQGIQQDCWSKRQSRAPRRFAEAGNLMEQAGLVRRVKLGRGSLLYVPDCAKAHSFLVERLKQTPDFLYATCKRNLE